MISPVSAPRQCLETISWLYGWDGVPKQSGDHSELRKKRLDLGAKVARICGIQYWGKQELHKEFWIFLEGTSLSVNTDLPMCERKLLEFWRKNTLKNRRPNIPRAHSWIGLTCVPSSQSEEMLQCCTRHQVEPSGKSFLSSGIDLLKLKPSQACPKNKTKQKKGKS